MPSKHPPTLWTIVNVKHAVQLGRTPWTCTLCLHTISEICKFNIALLTMLPDIVTWFWQHGFSAIFEWQHWCDRVQAGTSTRNSPFIEMSDLVHQNIITSGRSCQLSNIPVHKVCACEDCQEKASIDWQWPECRHLLFQTYSPASKKHRKLTLASLLCISPALQASRWYICLHDTNIEGNTTCFVISFTNANACQNSSAIAYEIAVPPMRWARCVVYDWEGWSRLECASSCEIAQTGLDPNSVQSTCSAWKGQNWSTCPEKQQFNKSITVTVSPVDLQNWLVNLGSRIDKLIVLKRALIAKRQCLCQSWKCNR